MAASNDVSGCIIKVDGTVLVQAKAGPSGSAEPAQMESVQVDKRLDCPDMFQFDLHIRPEADIKLLDDLREGKPVEIQLGPNGNEVTVLKGEIHYLEPRFRADGYSTLTVGGYDRSHRLTRGTQSRTWGDGSSSPVQPDQVVRDVISKAQEQGGVRDGLSASQVEGPGVQNVYVPQLNASDFLFMKALGQDFDRKVDAETGTDDHKVRFHRIDVHDDPVKVLGRGAGDADAAGVHEAQFTLSTVRQVARVEVRGWDAREKKAIVGVATAADYDFGGQPGWKATGQALYGSESAGKVLTIVDRPVESKAEADLVAKSIFNQLSMEFLQGEADFAGDPKVDPGCIVEFQGFGKRFSGKYLVVQATHSMHPRTTGFITRIRFVRNDVQ